MVCVHEVKDGHFSRLVTVDVRGEQLSQALAGPYHLFIGVIAFSLAGHSVTGVTASIPTQICRDRKPSRHSTVCLYRQLI